MSDPYVNAVERIGRLQDIAVIAEEFVRAHCALEDMASRLGAHTALSSLYERVLALHIKLEQLVLGDERVPGRRTT